MTQIIHLVGQQGSGKTLLGMRLTAGLTNQLQFCTLVQSWKLNGPDKKRVAMAAYPEADYLLLESETQAQAGIEAGDWFIDLNGNTSGQDQLLAATVEADDSARAPIIPVYLRLADSALRTMVHVDLKRLCTVAA